MILHLRTLEEITAAKLRLMGYYQQSGQFNAQNRAVLQGILETLKWVCHESDANSRINQLLEGFRLPEREVPKIKPDEEKP